MNWLSDFLSALFQRGSLMEPVEKIVHKVIWRLQPAWFYYERFVIMNYHFDTPLTCTRRLKSIRTRVGESSDMPALHRFMDRGKEYAHRFKKGDQVIVAELNGQIIGMQWVETGQVHYETKNEYCFPLPIKSFWTYDGHILVDWQVKGVWAGITDELICYLRKYAIDTVYCMVNGLNRHSINSHLRYGYRIRRQVVLIRFFGLRIQFERNLDQMTLNGGWIVKLTL